MPVRNKKTLLICMAYLFLSACDTGENYAPVTEIGMVEPIPKSGVHRVRQGETLYSVAWRYELDYRDVARQNHITESHVVHSGESLKVRKQAPLLPQQFQLVSPTKWTWPTKGKLITSFSKSHKGINFAGSLGDPIYAVASGKVVYCGDGLRGYGNLIIIKHDSLYLSAYAHNELILVKEGEWVQQGQKIAEMGSTGTDKVMLHFEIRRGGRPIDPKTLLMI